MSDLLLLGLVAATPLMLAVLGELLLQRAGMLNIGLEGFLLAGALSAVAVGVATGSAWTGLLGGIAGSMITALLFGFATIQRGGDQIVAGAAINFLAAGMSGVVYSRWTSIFVENVPRLTPFAQNASTLFAWVVAPAFMSLVLFSTTWGLRLRACGEYPAALSLQGFSPRRYRWAALLIEALFAGLAGGFLALALSNGFAENMTAGRGFIALAVVILGRWRPLGVVGGVALFGLTTALQYHFQATTGGVQFHLLLAVPYLLTLAILALTSGRVHAPEALGKSVP